MPHTVFEGVGSSVNMNVCGRHHSVNGIESAMARGRKVCGNWVRNRVLLTGDEFSARRGVPRQALTAAVRCGDLFSVGYAGRRYYLAALLDVPADAVTAVCRTMGRTTGAEHVIFWLRGHGGLGGRSVAAAINVGMLDRALQIAHAWADERGHAPVANLVNST